MKDDFAQFVEWFLRALTYRRTHRPCAFGDPLCPCQDGDPCHYVATPDSPAWGAPNRLS